MVLHAIFNCSTGQVTIEDISDNTNVDNVRNDKLIEISNLYQNSLLNGFVSSANGSSVQYGYSQNMQMVYSKWANMLALDPNRTSVTFSTPNGQITLTRDQFIQFMNDAETFEMDLFNSKTDFENQVNSAITIDQLNAIIVSF